MPWKNEGGGWQSGGGGGRGPWGQGPQGPSGGGNNGRGPGGGIPPDLDEIIRRGQDALRKALPGGGGWSTFLVPLALVLAFAAYRSVNQVQADERGVVLQLGQYARTVGPGLRFAVWPLESLEKVRVEYENQTSFGGDKDNSGLMLAGDQNLVDIKFSVFWKINDPQAFLFNLQEPNKVVGAVGESAMREIVGRTAAEEVRTKGLLAVQDQVLEITQKTLDSYKSGILVTAVKLERADPPQKVVSAFEEVQRAEQDQANSINEADLYANQKNRSAEGEVAKIVEDAKAYKAQVVLEAEGEAQRFTSVYKEYAKAPDVTRQRLYLETLESVLGKSNKVIIEGGQGGSNGVVPYLPLPEIQKQTTEPAQGTTP